MTTLYLVRHGETEENKQHILQGHQPGTLSQLGIEQAHKAAEQVRDMHFDVCLSSDLKRCADTTQIIMEGRTDDINVLYTTMLRERHWGSATGKPCSDYQNIPVPADAESMPALAARCRVFLDYIKKMYAGKRVLIVSHGFVLRILQATYLGVDFHDIQMLTNAEVREFVIE